MIFRLEMIVKENRLAILAAIFIGLIYIAPNIIFIASLGDNYKGIPIMQTANEDFYLARIQEILDGHPTVGSPAFFEYKNKMPISPPTVEFFYSIPSLIFNISPINILIASRFFLPAILFLLIYFLIKRLTRDDNILSNKINAIAGAFFVVLGYDLIDFRTILGYLKGGIPPGDFLIWSRPINPILGAIFLISFLIFLWSIVVRKNELGRKKFYIAGASIFLALMIMSYFFSWGMAISITGALILIYLFKKEYKTVKNLITVVIFGFLFSTPYWYFSWQASKDPWYHDLALRYGLLYTHYPLINKFIVVVLVVYLILIFLTKLIARREKINIHFEDWHWFCLAFILGSLLVYNQQVITGMTIWPYHFVQYTIPLAIIVLIALFYNIVKPKMEILWRVGIFIIILSSLIFGVYTQASTYNRFYSHYSDMQPYVELFNWVNSREKDCVILIYSQTRKNYFLNGFIPAFTHCNIYNSNWSFSMMPTERIRHNYFTYMAFDGATDQNIEKYLDQHKNEARGYLFDNWKELYSVRDFPDIENNIEERIRTIPEDYKKFIAEDLKGELKRYKLDYILVDGEVSDKAVDLISKLGLVYQLNNISVYQLK